MATSPRSTARTAPGRLTDAAAPAAADDQDLSRIVTWPNAVTVVRLALIPVYVWLLFATAHQLPRACCSARSGSPTGSTATWRGVCTR